MTVHVSGSGIGDRVNSLFSEIGFNVLKVFVAGGIIASIPGALLGVTVPGEGMTRAETVEKNVMADHERIWNFAISSAEGVGDWLNEKS